MGGTSNPFRAATVAILASGPSMNAETVRQVVGSGIASIAINATYRLAPRADALFAADWEWWDKNSEALAFPGLKLVGRHCNLPGVMVFPTDRREGGNSALYAAQFAESMGAAEILLFGVDLLDDEPDHWHGPHEGLNNPTAAIFEMQRRAWAQYAKKAAATVVNCNPRSGLNCFPFGFLSDYS